MSGSLTLALRTAQSGLLSNQQALDSVSNNIANVNSPGYSRKVVNMEQRVVAGAGAGVQVSSVVRKVDEGLMKSLRLELSSLNQLDAKDPYLQRVQELFGKPSDNTSLSHSVTEFLNAIETLAVNPANTMEQSEVMRQGKDVTDMLQRMSGMVQELRLQTDADIAAATERVGELLTSVHTLNNKLIANTAINVDVTDLEDQRDQALDELSTLVDIRYYHRADGDVVVFTEGGRTLVDNTAAAMTHLQASAVSATTNHSEGDLNGIYVGAVAEANDITNEIRNGKLKGLVDLRDTVLTNMQGQLDEFSGKLRDVMNSVHNAGAPYPGFQTMSGTRNFIDTDTQTMKLEGTSDVTIALMDINGHQTAVTTLDTIMTSALYGTGAQTSHDNWTIDEVAASVEDWMQANGLIGASVSISNTTDGKMSIDLNSTTAYVMFRDESATASGSTAQDATITFDSNGTATAGGTETHSGFANFFGLNDFFVDDLPDNIHDSQVLASTYTLGTSTTLSFHNANSGVGATIGGASVNLTAGMTLDQIVTTINATTDVGVTASKVADGAGFRLRLSENNGVDMVVTANNTFNTDIGLQSANVRTAGQIKVRDDIVSLPANISRGALQWDAAKGAAGEYLMSASDDSNLQALVTRLNQSTQFNTAGGLSAMNVSFISYSTSIISDSASLTNTNNVDLEYQSSLTSSLQAKSDNFRGVNLDEEMTNLMLYEQAYGAAARIVSTVQKMFDALEQVV
ncbi:flagellar hook-associated protein FlgK [Pseudomonadota bacterium]